MSWLLDTNVLAELRKGPRADPSVMAWFASTDEADLFTSVLVIGEARRGIESIRRRDAVAAQALEQWLLRLRETFADRVLPIDEDIAERWGALNVPDPVPAVDGLLAATGLVHDLTVVTRNIRDMERTGVRLFNPFDG
ncbi:MAG: type II toxin-antitoxin system VapC family toxin [Alphaproteobacteria bacterium]|nr:type II toxin-antitoxin system VapC family toxin [Alphaproteobacteria bacterium]